MTGVLYDYALKFIIVGDSTVGKSNIMANFTDKRFLANHDTTIGVEFGTKLISLDSTKYKIQIWDTAGQEIFKSITRSYYRGTIGCLLVYDITNRESFESIIQWSEEIKTYCDHEIVVVLVGNKKDIEENRKITYEEGENLAKKLNINFFETSAKTSYNIENAFINIVQTIKNKIEIGKINIMKNNRSIQISSTKKDNQNTNCLC